MFKKGNTVRVKATKEVGTIVRVLHYPPDIKEYDLEYPNGQRIMNGVDIYHQPELIELITLKNNS